MADLKFSVCIPAYNRPEVLGTLLDSIIAQDYSNYEIVIGEDTSPRRNEIRSIAALYQKKYPERITYFENEHTLGFDANIRRLIEKAKGQYCFFMGNDDLICPKALSTVSNALDRYDNVGVVLRSYASFDDNPKKINQIFRYFREEKIFSSGSRTIINFFRRSVVISGMVIHRQTALLYSTDQFDGTLLYQVYLVANILADMNGVYLPEITVLYRNGGIPEFGNSKKEQGKFVPKDRTIESSLQFMHGMLGVAQYVEKTRKVKIYNSILRDIGNYSYPILAIQANQPFRLFLKYCFRLAEIGFWSNPLFYIYFVLIIMFRPRRIDKLIRAIKNKLGYTPELSKI